MADVTIFENANFQGRSQSLPKGPYDDAAHQLSFGNDMISSLKVPQGLVARLYEHFHFQGRFIDIEEDTPVLSLFWNEQTSSIIVHDQSDVPPVIKEVLIFEDANYAGKSQTLGKGQYDTAQITISNKALSSALVPYGMVLRLYENANFQGAFIEIREDTPAVRMDWNDRASSVVVDELAIPVPVFAENEVEILDEASFELPNDLIAGIQSGLFNATVGIAGEITSPNASQVKRIISARSQWRSFLANPQFHERQAKLRSIMELLLIRDFDVAEPALKDFDEQSVPLFVNLPALGHALSSAPVNFIDTTIEEIPHELPGKPPRKVTTNTRRTLPGYGGPRPTEIQHSHLTARWNFLSKGIEHRFRVDLLQAEIYVGQSRYIDGINVYNSLLTAIPADHPRHKFIAMRAALAELALGDLLFRKFRNPDEVVRNEIRTHYTAALNRMETSRISPENPRFEEIVGYATVQLRKLDTGMNFLGYRDGYVPIMKPDILKDLAERRIERARDAITKFEIFKDKADQIQSKLKDLDFEQDIKTIDNEISANRVANTKAQRNIAFERAEQIQSKLNDLDTQLVNQVAGSIMGGVAVAMAGGGGGGFSASGTVSLFLENATRKEDLDAQKIIAEIEKGIATRDVAIAQLEQTIIGNSLNFLGDKIQRIQNGELNADLYYAAGVAFRALAERHLDAAILLAYLFERAVAFLRLEPELEIIQFDYLPLIQQDQLGNTLSAADRLASHLEDVVGKNIPLTKFQFLTETYSLRLLYPIEFNRFLQTGDMDFTLSLYELNKRRPGVWRQRIKRVNVDVRGLIPITGYTGLITHHGSFLMRDKDTTPEPGTGRFIPTDEQLNEAFEELKNGATQGVPIDGVIPFLLDKDEIQLSPDQNEPDPGDPETGALRPIEGYGPSGHWSLKIENIDLRLVTDVLLKITYVIPESDNDLARRVRGLIATYEQELSPEERLDLITAFSLRQQFPDTFSQLIEGQASLSLLRSEFPAGITDLRLKAVVAQALDQQKKGIEGLSVEIARLETTLDLVRTTRADGFSEEVTAEIPSLPSAERFPVEGTYTLRLPDPNQASRLDDLILFFIYEFREI